MPTYSYRCTECEAAFDVQQSFTDDSLTVCPTCGGVLRKVFSPIGVSFTGSGFYRNDSRAKPEVSGEGGGAHASESSKSDKAGEKPSEKAGTSREKSAEKSTRAESGSTGSSGSSGKDTSPKTSKSPRSGASSATASKQN